MGIAMTRKTGKSQRMPWSPNSWTRQRQGVSTTNAAMVLTRSQEATTLLCQVSSILWFAIDRAVPVTTAREPVPPCLPCDSDDGFDPPPSRSPQGIDPANLSLSGPPPHPLPPLQRIDPANLSLAEPPPPSVPPFQRIDPANLSFAEPRPPPAYRKSTSTTYEERIAVKALRHIAKMSYEDIAAGLHITIRQAQYAATGPTKPQHAEKCGRKPKGVGKKPAGG